MLYQTPKEDIFRLIKILQQSKVTSNIFLIDNSEQPTNEYNHLSVDYIYTHQNLGYGKAHNIAIHKSIEQNADYHLVVNPDISFDPEILTKIVLFMNENAEIGHLMPKVFYPDGNIQYLCKLLPTPFDLFFRRFLPEKWTRERMNRFEMRESGYDRLMDVPYLSGCFMFLRVAALKEVGTFDERFFMYPEDIDLTRRIHRKYRTVFYPEVSIVHHHAQSSYKSGKMMWIHAFNLMKYFNKWGWISDKERKRINTEILIQLR